MKLLYSYILVCILLVATPVAGQSFTTQVSAKLIGKKDFVQVQYVAENLDLSNFLLPTFKGWAVQSGPNFSSNMVQMGNQVKQQIIYSFILLPMRTGRLSIPAATITIDKNNSRQSNTVTVDVRDVDHVGGNAIPQTPAAPPLIDDDPPARQEDFSREQILRRGESARDKIKNNLLIKLDVNKNTAYVGEPILATYKLCTRLRSQSRVVKQPSFSGTTVTELNTENLAAKQEMINGRMYKVYVIRKVQLTPLKAGTFVLPPASVENKVTFYKAENINFRDLYYNPSANDIEETQVTLSNQPVSITVNELPSPVPANFDGAVGKFVMGAGTPTEKPITTNTTLNFIVIIDGEGNLQEAKAPTIHWPNGIEGFEPKEQEEADKNSFPVKVRKIFTYPFVVSKAGQYTIPATGFHFFNPATNKYMTITSKAVSFKVEKGSPLSFINKPGDTSGFQSRLYIVLAAGLFAVGLGLLFFNRRSKVKPAVAAVRAAEIHQEPQFVQRQVDAEQFIHNIRELSPLSDGAFYKQLQKQVEAFLNAKFNVSESGLDKVAMEHPAEADTIIRLKSLLSDCKLGMYTPLFTAEEEEKHRLLAIELLSRLHRAG